MLFSVDKIMKLGGKRLHGQVTSVEVDEEASIDDIKKKNQKTKKNQPTGYEGATIRIEIMLEKEKGTEVSERSQHCNVCSGLTNRKRQSY